MALARAPGASDVGQAPACRFSVHSTVGRQEPALPGWLWTFLEVEGVEPTNNAAERSLRQAVIWRKLSFGTQSESGSRFVERMLSVIETCRQQDQNVLTYVTNAVEAHFQGKSAPSLFTNL